MSERTKAPKYDLPAIYHEHDGPSEHHHDHTGLAHYAFETGHYHLTEVYTADEIGEKLGVSDGGEDRP